MKFTYIIFAMFIFTGILLGLGGFYNDLTSTYSTGNTTNVSAPAILMQSELSSTYNSSFGYMNSTDGGLSGGTSIWTIFGLILKAPVYIAKAFMSTGSNIISATNTFGTTIGAPGWMLGLIALAVLFVILIAVIRMTLNKEI